MTKHGLTLWAIGGGIAAALCASTLPAQVDTTRRDTTRTARSTTRIPIRKASRGEVMPKESRVEAVLPSRDARGDSSVRQVRADSIPGQFRADSIGRQVRRDSINTADLARNDSIVAAERVRTDSIRALRVSTPADSIAQAIRTDSVARGEQARTDSISRLEQVRNDSIARVTAPTLPLRETETMPTQTGRRLPGSFYMGLAAGSASPTGDLEDLGYDSGLSISVPIGWHNPSSVFGVRVMLGYNQFNGATFRSGGANPVILNNADPKVYSAELNLNMRFPFNERRTSSVYLTGGGGVYLFRNFGQGSALAGYLGNDVLDPDDSNNESTINKWGVNGGAGLEFGIGTSSLFLETRLVNVFAGRDDEPNFDSVFGERGSAVRWMPLIIGFTIR